MILQCTRAILHTLCKCVRMRFFKESQDVLNLAPLGTSSANLKNFVLQNNEDKPKKIMAICAMVVVDVF